MQIDFEDSMSTQLMLFSAFIFTFFWKQCTFATKSFKDFTNNLRKQKDSITYVFQSSSFLFFGFWKQKQNRKAIPNGP